MTDQPKTPRQAAQDASGTMRQLNWDAIAQAAIQASGLVEALHGAASDEVRKQAVQLVGQAYNTGWECAIHGSRTISTPDGSKDGAQWAMDCARAALASASAREGEE